VPIELGDVSMPGTDTRVFAARSQQDIEYALNGIGPRRQAFNDSIVRVSNGASDWLRQHWLAVVNVTLGAFIGVAVLVPVAYAFGLTGPASAIFHAYRFACDELPSHSFHIFGYQTCLCARCLAIYTSMLLTGIFLAVARNRRTFRGINWWMWLVAMVPMALDGGTQFFGWRESNVWLRLLTGAIFGVATAWFTLPHIDEAARDELAVAPASAPPPRPVR
jgi:uncharacterized membrane protein